MFNFLDVTDDGEAIEKTNHFNLKIIKLNYQLHEC